MEQTKSASELLALIERKYFRGAGLDKASRTEGDERRAYRLERVERGTQGQVLFHIVFMFMYHCCYNFYLFHY
jgi:hypothetical protein